MTQPESRFYPRVFALVTAGVLGYALLRILEPFFGAILWALLLAFLLFPVNRALRRRLGGRRGAAALLLTLGSTLLVVGPAALLAVAFARQGVELIGRLQAVADRYQVARGADFLGVPVLGPVLLWLQARVPVTGADVQAWAVSGAKGLLQTLVSLSGSFFVGALGVLVGLGVTLFLLFFFLRDGEELAGRLVALIPMDATRKTHLVEHLSAVTRAVVFGALLTGLVQGALVGIAFAIGGLPSPVVFGALGAVASLLPLVGSALVWGPGAGALAVQGRWGAALFVALWGALVVSSADNFVRPLFISGRAQISTLPVFLGLMGGISAFGPIGLFLGPVVVALVLALLRLAEASRAPGDAA
jgi:predicted PurR-regulated permease PerM